MIYRIDMYHSMNLLYSLPFFFANISKAFLSKVSRSWRFELVLVNFEDSLVVWESTARYIHDVPDDVLAQFVVLCFGAVLPQGGYLWHV